MIYKYQAEARREAETSVCWFVSYVPRSLPKTVARNGNLSYRVEDGRPRMSDGTREASTVFAVVNLRDYDAAVALLERHFGPGDVLAASPKSAGFMPKAWR